MIKRPLALILVLILLVSFMPAEAGFSRSLVKKAVTSPKAENTAVLEAETPISRAIVQPVNAVIERVRERIEYEVFRDELDDLDIEYIAVSRRTPAIAGADVRLVMTLRNNGDSDIENAVMEIDYQYEHANNLQINLPRVIESGQAVYLFPVLYFPQPMNYELLFTISAGDEEETYNHELEIEANHVQQAPVVYDIPDFDFDEYIEEGESIFAYDLDDYVTDANGDEITWEPSNYGEINVIRNEDNEVSYSAPVYYNEDHTITWTAEDEEGDTDSDDSTITINDINTAPFFEPELPDPEPIDEDTTDNEISIDLWEYAQDHDNNDDELTYEIIEETNTEVIDCRIDDNRYFRCSDPSANQFGESEITVNLSDEEFDVQNSLTVTVNSVNDIPVIDEVTVEPNQEDPGIYEERDEITITINFHDDDAENEDGETLTFTVYEQDHEDEPVCEEDATGEQTATCTIEPLETGEYTYIAKIMDDEEGEDTEEIPLTINELYTVNGAVTQLFAEEDLDDESPLPEMRVQYINLNEDLEYEEEDETNDDGEYEINLEHEGQYRIIITHPDEEFYERVTYQLVEEDMTRNENVIPVNTTGDEFSMDFFNILARPENDERTTRRWAEQPETFYINTSEMGVHRLWTPPEELVDDVANVIGGEDGEMPWLFDGFMDEPNIERTDTPPWREDNTLLFRWGHGHFNGHLHEDGVIYWSDAMVIGGLDDFDEMPSVYRSELGGAMGMYGDNDEDELPNLEGLSVFNNGMESSDTYTDIDAMAGKLLYNRPAGSIRPDTDPNPFDERRDAMGFRIHTWGVYARADDGRVIDYEVEFSERIELVPLNLNADAKEFLGFAEDDEVSYKWRTKELVAKKKVENKKNKYQTYKNLKKTKK